MLRRCKLRTFSSASVILFRARQSLTPTIRPYSSRFTPSFDPYSYSRGHWLDQDQARRKARRLHFDFDALLAAAVSNSRGARKVVACEKKEGGFNRVFVLKLDNGSQVVAKVPMQYAGPSGLTTMSEVATLKYVGDRTSVPVPKILAWTSAANSGPVGAEYIIMEHVPGVALQDVWDRMTELQHITLIESAGKYLKELCALEFPALGSLYLNTADKPSSTVIIDDEYCIGPHCGRNFWGVTPTGQVVPRLLSILEALKLSSYFADLEHMAELTIARRNLSSERRRDHSRLLQMSRYTIDAIQGARLLDQACNSVLSHPDLHARNIFVDLIDPTRILGIIDWQSTGIEPAFLHAMEPPDFAEEPMLDEVLDANSKSSEVDDVQTHAQRCKKTWVAMVYQCPQLRGAMSLDYDLYRYLSIVSSGASDDILALQSSLDGIRKKWNELGLPGACPYERSPEEIQRFEEQLEQAQSTERVRMYLARSLRCETDGWVEAGRWNQVLPRYREEYAEFVEACIDSRGENETVEDARRKADELWPFDLR